MPAVSDNDVSQASRFETLVAGFGLITLVGLTTALIVRTFGLEVAYYDEYDNFGNALVLLGDPLPSYFTARAPFAVLAQLPAMALIHAEIIERSLLVPHLVALAITLSGLALSFRFIRMSHSASASAMAVVMLACNRIVLHYAPFAENTGTSLLALALALPLISSARANPSTKRVILAAFGIALAGLARSNFLALGPITVIYWILYPKFCKDESRRESLDLGALISIGLLSILMWNGTYVLLDIIRNGLGAGIPLLSGFEHSLTLLATAINPTQAALLTADFLFYLQVLPLICGWPTVLLALIGLAIIARRRTGLDLLVLLSAPILLVLISRFPWYEARYAIAIVPLMAYLAASPLQWLIEVVSPSHTPQRIAAGGTLLLIFIGTLHTASLETSRWKDPFFSLPSAHKLAEFIEEKRGNQGRVFWRGPFHAFYPQDQKIHPDDPYYSIFHFPSKALSYLLDRRVTNRFELSQLRKGDVVVWNPNPLITTGNIPDGPTSLEILSFRSVSLTKTDPSQEGIGLVENDGILSVISTAKIAAITLTKADGSVQSQPLPRPVTETRVPRGFISYDFLVYDTERFGRAETAPDSAESS
ncbi:MAG: hypothetical protein P8Q97_06835 [Myxococcota bacterium]|jgi:hypothetical protein|nr:hypothetical protein [Myxococcota bacterium]